DFAAAGGTDHCGRRDGSDPESRLPAGRQRAQNVCEGDWWPGVLPALRRGAARRVSVAVSVVAQPIHAWFLVEQSGERWQVPQAHDSARESGDERTSSHHRPENRQADQVYGSGEGRLQSAAPSGVADPERTGAQPVRRAATESQGLDSPFFHTDANSLTLA